jgi:hypothetical protein
MLDLDKPVFLKYKDKVLGSFNVFRNQQTMVKTIRDPKDWYAGEITISLPN